MAVITQCTKRETLHWRVKQKLKQNKYLKNKDASE